MDNTISQITICKKCKGWNKVQGQEEFACPECGGKGVFIQKGSEKLIFGMPPFVDFGSRKRAIVLKKLSIVILLVLFVFTISGVAFIVFQLF
jgi:DNA-directed RNA polymerase subunit RPC12/RpoP